MTRRRLVVEPGDVLVTRNRRGLAARLIRLGAALRDLPNLHNHVAVAHHVDAAGVPWGIEGRPGGAGWVDLRGYLASPDTLTNAAQTKTPEQRERVAAATLALLGTDYDWHAIARDALGSLDVAGRLDDLWRRPDPGGSPAHVVCSSLADYAYTAVGLASPDRVGSRYTTPADWSAFILGGCQA